MTGQLRARRARAARARSAAGRRHASSTCARNTRPTGPDVILSRALRDGDRRRGSSGSEQALVLLNRRGFATAVFCRQCAGDARLPELQRVAGRARRRRAAPRALPLLQLLDARAEGLPAVRRAVSRAGRLRHRARRGGSATRCVPARASRRVDRDTIRRKGALDGAAVASSRRRDRRARRHADDREGARLSARHAGRRRLGRRRPRPRRLPRRRADVPAADAGRRPRRPRRAAGRGDRPDALSGPLQHPAAPAGRTTRRSTSDELHVPPARCAIRRASR